MLVVAVAVVMGVSSTSPNNDDGERLFAVDDKKTRD